MMIMIISLSLRSWNIDVRALERSFPCAPVLLFLPLMFTVAVVALVVFLLFFCVCLVLVQFVFVCRV